LRFAKRSSTRAGLLVAAVVAAAIVGLVGLLVDTWPVGIGGLVVATAVAGGLAVYLIVTERRRHEVVEGELTEQASFLESLVDSMKAIAEAEADPETVLEQARRESERLFEARVSLLDPGERRQRAPAEHTLVVPLRAREEEIGALFLVRADPFERGDVVRAMLLADFAARARENARLLEEAKVRELERGRLSDQLITAEQDERRRLALFLHDGPVQSMSGIALMLDAVHDAIEEGRMEDARSVVENALDRHRDTIRSLRDLSFNLEPVVLRDQGFAPAVRALAEQVGLASRVQVDVDVDAAEALSEQTQAALYQIIRDALNGAVRRGPPSRISVAVRQDSEGGFETVIVDDAPGERRRASFEELEERARTLNGKFRVDQGDDGGTTVAVTLPSYTVGR
jgi:signal transduction histidine kinase